MKPYLLFSFILSVVFAFCGSCYAQSTIPNLTNVIQPSPTVAAMQKYGDVPVSLYNGVPDISIPLYTIKTHDITVPVSVSYHASGIKVAQDASNVGLGWVLNAGGAISRKIIGFDDFQSGTYFTASPATQDLTSGYAPVTPIQQGDVYNNGQSNQVSLVNTLAVQSAYDYEPDQFYYNLPNGKSGKFMLLRNYSAVLQSPERMDIQCMQDGTNGPIDGNVWQIKTIDGYTYTFSNVVESYTPSGGPNINHMTAVYLTQITSPTNNTVTFHYALTNQASGSNGVVTVPGSWSQSVDAGAPQYASGYNVVPIPPVNGPSPGQNFTCYSLSYIDFDSGQVQFSYSYGRQDVTNDNQLNAITVYAKDNNGNLLSTPLKTYTFAYNFANGFTPNASNTFNPNLNTSPNYVQRMMLQSITESGTYNGQTVTLPPYNFAYYTSLTPGYGVDLPIKDSFAVDHWGYFNGMTSNTTFIPTFYQASSSAFLYWEGIMGNQREVNANNSNTNYMQAWSLSDITYPTGGSTHFDYEPNDCDEQNSEINDHAGYNYNYTLVTSPNAPYSGTWSSSSPTTPLPILDLTDEFTDPSLGSIPVSVQMAYVLSQSSLPPTTSFQPGTAGIKIYKYDSTKPGGIGIFYTSFDPVLDATGGNPVPSGGAITDVQKISLPPGKYVIQPYASTSSSTNYSYYISHISFPFGSWLTQVNSSPPAGVTNPVTYSQAGGLRIKRITENDGIHAPKIKKYSYHYNLNGLNLSYGRRMSRPRYTYWEESEDAFVVINAGNNTYQWTFYPDHTMRVSNSVIALDGSASGAVVGYDQVRENIGENGEGGYSIYKYHNNPDTLLGYFYNPYTSGPALPRYRPYNSNLSDPLNGSLLEQTDYKTNGQPVHDVTNTYQQLNQGYVYAIENHIDPHFTTVNDVGSEIIVYGNGSWSQTYYPDQYSPTPAPTYDPTVPNDRLLFTYPAIRPFWTTLQSSTVTDYSVSDPTKFQQKVTNYYYEPADFMQTAVTETNSKNEIITRQTSYPLDFLGSTATDPVSQGIQNMISNHVYNAPVETYTQISSATGTNARVVSGIINQYQSSGMPTINQIYQLQTAMPITNFSALSLNNSTMNSAYQPLIQFGTNYDANGNLLQQNKYQDINHAYQWAYHKDYPIAECKNATANEFFFDGFEDDGTLSTITSQYGAHTGTKASTATTVSWTVPDSRSYVITYWYYNSSTLKWVFVPEQAYTGNTFTLTGTNAVAFDDVRIFPSDAQITTYTYDPLVGMTSSTDAKGMPTYFEYDGMQRLMNIKDKDGYIIRNYKYYYQ